MRTLWYFFITYARKKKENSENVEFIVPEKKSQKSECIFIDEKYENLEYYYNKLTGKGKKKNIFNFGFEIDDEKSYLI